MRKHLLKTGLMAMTAAISISSSIPVFASGETEIFGDGIEAVSYTHLSKSVMIQMRIYYENKNYRIIGN